MTPWLLFATAAALRLFRLGNEPLWFDEAYTALEAGRPLGDLLGALRQEAGAPLYTVSLWIWTRITGDSEWVLRLPSALAGAAAAPLLHRLGSELHSPRAGLIAGVLAVVSPLHVHYSQEARMYSLVALVALVALLVTWRLATEPSLAGSAGLGLVLLAGLYLHYYFLFFLPVPVLAVLGGQRATVRCLAVAGAIVALGFAPWLPTLLQQSANPSTSWIADSWESRSLAYAVPWSLESLGPGALYPTWQTLELASSPTLRAVSLALALAIVAGLVALARGARDRPASLLVLASILVPLLLACAVSIVHRPVYVVARYDLIAWGPYLLGAGIVAARLGRGGPLLALAWVALSAFTLAPHFASDREIRNYADLGPTYAERLTEIALPGETVVFTAGTRTTTEYYLRDARRGLRLVSFPLANDDHLGWVLGRVHTDEDFAAEQAALFVERVIDVAEPPPVLWIAAPKSRGTDALLRLLASRGYRPDRTRSVTSLLCVVRAG